MGKRIYAAYVRCPKCGQSGLTRNHEVIEQATRHSTGRGVTHLTCSFCDYADDRPYTISRISDNDSGGSSGSSFSGGGGSGGGSSSGGGASGRW